MRESVRGRLLLERLRRRWRPAVLREHGPPGGILASPRPASYSATRFRPLVFDFLPVVERMVVIR